jgi:ABC-type multidrug transport system ATPase subunit
MMVPFSAQMVDLTGLRVRAPTERGRPTAVLSNVTLQVGSGVHAIVGSPKDGTTLLLNVIDGTITPKAGGGRVFVVGGAPDQTRAHISRVSLEAPLPEALRVKEVCDLAGELRGDHPRPATERLGLLGLESLANRRVSSLSIEERRAVVLALALTSQKTDVLLIEEPLAGLDLIAPRRVVDALRARAASACVIVTTASPKDAVRLGDRIFVLTNGVLAPIASHYLAQGIDEGATNMKIVVGPDPGAAGAAHLLQALTTHPAVAKIESTTIASGAVILSIAGKDLALLARAVTQTIAATNVEVELVEAGTLSLDSIRHAMAARAASPPPGSLPPQAPTAPAPTPTPTPIAPPTAPLPTTP